MLIVSTKKIKIGILLTVVLSLLDFGYLFLISGTNFEMFFFIVI